MFDQRLIYAVFKQLWNTSPSETKLLTLNKTYALLGYYNRGHGLFTWTFYMDFLQFQRDLSPQAKFGKLLYIFWKAIIKR